MDSMRSLNSSLPSSRTANITSPDLLQAFRTAALSVTNLYKSAAADQVNSRQAGYQDALEDLLKFLDDEDLGVQDGEGWRIRQWATQRFDGGSYQQQSEEDDENEQDTRHTQLPSTTDLQPDETLSDKQQQTDSQESTLLEDERSLPDETVFKFTGSGEGESHMQMDGSSSSQSSDDSTSSSPSIKVEVLNRSKSSIRNAHGRHPNRPSHREFTFTAGTKRKLHFPDFFDISNVSDRKDGNVGPKRGRF